MTELCSIRDVGKRLGIAPHQIAYAHAQERLPEPQYRVAGKRIYTADDVAMVAAYFAEKSRKKGHGE
jgi:DNA-binding transcriptional MerR regulator